MTHVICRASSPPLPLPNPIPPTPTTHHFIESVVIPPRVSKAIPIVAPPPESPKLQEIMASLEGKQLHEKKQLLGDQLFPLVKVYIYIYTFCFDTILIALIIGYWSKRCTQDYHTSFRYH